MEDIEKKIRRTQAKKRTEEKTTPSKKIQKLGNVSPRRSGGRKTKAPSADKRRRWKVHRRPLWLGGKQKAEIKTPSTCSIGRQWQK